MARCDGEVRWRGAMERCDEVWRTMHAGKKSFSIEITVGDAAKGVAQQPWSGLFALVVQDGCMNGIIHFSYNYDTRQR
jgi:hypothetical protein